MTETGLVVALSGGVGGAKLALGLSRILPADRLLIVANTGDDFEHLGLSISPDIDTLLYVLAGLDNPVTGWGRRDETWSFMETLESIGGETWFRLGDRDLALHVERTRRLGAGDSLSAIVADFARRLGVGPRILPMSDVAVRTRVDTDEGRLDFQEYFVHRQCRPEVRALVFDDAATARAQPEILAALRDPALSAVILCPSNPFISIAPMLALPELRAALERCAAPIVAVSPIIGGAAVKGPTAKMMREFGSEVSAAAIARWYGRLIDGFVVDPGDAAALAEGGLHVATTDIMMRSLEDRERVARAALDAAATIRRRRAA